MVVYSYDGRTGRYIAGEMADPDPLEPGQWLIPANAVTEMPPEQNGTLWPYWTGLAWELRDEGTAERERFIRVLRSEALISSDWTQLADAPLNKNARDAWRVYRQQLRDLTKNPAWPFVDLPAKPDA